MLPFITSPVTTAVMEWINADVQRRRCWLERAEQSLSQADRSAAIASLAASLCDEITASVAQQDLIAQKLVHTILMGINYYELAISLLSDIGFLAPAHSQMEGRDFRYDAGRKSPSGAQSLMSGVPSNA